MAPVRWLAGLCVAGGFAIASCGGTTISPRLRLLIPDSVILGVAEECTGAPGAVSHPVQVTVHRGSLIVVTQTKLGSFNFKFSLPAGQYRVTTNQSGVIPVDVCRELRRE